MLVFHLTSNAYPVDWSKEKWYEEESNELDETVDSEEETFQALDLRVDPV